MKKIMAVLLMLCLALPLVAQAEEVQWDFPVPLETVMSEYVRLVNREVLLQEEYAPDDLIYVDTRQLATSGRVQLRQACYNALQSMFAAAKEEGINLYVRSGYRSYGTQKKNYNNRLERNNGVDDGFVAPPGSSEHQTGLACDLTDDEYRWESNLVQDFANTKAAKWLVENAASFGFIYRYMPGKEDITQTSYEPWHYRYVGVNAARYIMGRELTLEEFTDEWNLALADFQGAGGDVEQAIKDAEERKLNGPEVTYSDEEGEQEVSILF